MATDRPAQGSDAGSRLGNPSPIAGANTGTNEEIENYQEETSLARLDQQTTGRIDSRNQNG